MVIISCKGTQGRKQQTSTYNVWTLWKLVKSFQKFASRRFPDPEKLMKESDLSVSHTETW
nr:BPK_HP1_G0044070.mRNA.1.CDS.1 [Saccharomyces cerevisiae]